MKRDNLKNQCWICRRTKEELSKLFDDKDFSVQLHEIKNSAYCGYHVCDICRDLVVSITVE